MIYNLEELKALADVQHSNMLREATTPAPKKSGWLKVAAMVIAAGTAGIWWGKRNSDKSQVGDKPAQKMVQQAVNPNAGLRTLLERKQIEYEMAKLDAAKSREQLSLQRDAAYTGRYTQEQNQRSIQGQAYTGYYVREKGQESMRSSARTTREFSATSRQVRQNRGNW